MNDAMERRQFLRTLAKAGVLLTLKPWELAELFAIPPADASLGLLPNYVLRQPTLITDFSSSTGMTFTQGTGTVALDTDATKVRTGTKSLKITNLANSQSAFADLDCRNNFGGGASGIDASRDANWHLRCFVTQNQSSLSFFPANSVGFATYFAAQKMGPQIGGTEPNRWWDRPENRKDWVVGAGSPSWGSPIQTIRIRPVANANGPLTTWCDALYRGGYARPKILFTFDDASSTQITIAKPILDTYGLKGTFYVIGQPVSLSTVGAISQAEADTLYAEGHDICAHSWTQDGHTNWATLTAAQVRSELQNHLDWAGARGYTRGRYHHAHPLGATNATIEAVLAEKAFLTSRSTRRLIQSHLLGIDIPYYLRGYSWTSADGTAGPIAFMNDAVTYGSTLLLTFHTFHATTSSAQQISSANFTTIVQYAKQLQAAGLADVGLTISNWYNGLSNQGARRSRS